MGAIHNSLLYFCLQERGIDAESLERTNDENLDTLASQVGRLKSVCLVTASQAGKTSR